MSMQDPIADMLTRVRNALMAKKETVSIPFSRQKKVIADLLMEEGYISGVDAEGEVAEKKLVISLKYFEGMPVIENIKRISKPSLRVYRGKDELPKVKNGLGIAIVSTSQGVMTSAKALIKGLGGEIICYVS